jgi:hypothetical protein
MQGVALHSSRLLYMIMWACSFCTAAGAFVTPCDSSDSSAVSADLCWAETSKETGARWY